MLSFRNTVINTPLKLYILHIITPTIYCIYRHGEWQSGIYCLYLSDIFISFLANENKICVFCNVFTYIVTVILEPMLPHSLPLSYISQPFTATPEGRSVLASAIW